MRAYYELIYSYLKDAETYYPEFRKWYTEKVIPGLFFADRELIIENRDNNIAGIAIIKKEENKLCTLRITDNFQNKGIGLKLFEKSFESLNTEKPFLTVSEEKLVEFEKIFKYYGFKMTSIHNDLYRKGKKEYFFNEF
jgi:N-acetylglutamate synthase-like GNAT family acetyltransferase